VETGITVWREGARNSSGDFSPAKQTIKMNTLITYEGEQQNKKNTVTKNNNNRNVDAPFSFSCREQENGEEAQNHIPLEASLSPAGNRGSLKRSGWRSTECACVCAGKQSRRRWNAVVIFVVAKPDTAIVAFVTRRGRRNS